MTARVYVGTYEKYNNGSIGGAWLDLDKFADSSEYAEACRELHKDEDDPEFMLQDFEGFPARFYSESGLDDGFWDWLALDEDDRAMLEAYLSNCGDDASFDEAQEAYQGQYNSDVDFVMDLLDGCGDIPQDLPSYICIDWEATARNIMYDYFSENGYYFRNF